MLAMSSTSSSSHHQPTNPFLATNLGGGSSSSPWPLQLLEDPFLITTNYHHQHSLLDTHFINSPPPPLPFIDLPPESFAGEEEQQVTKKDSSSSGGGTVITTIKKLNHNASERHRRKKINTLYSSLRSMLPPTDHHPTKKLSIPNTVSRVLKYIPELQQQVEALERKKKELMSAVSNDKQLDNNKQDGHVDQNPNIILDDDHHHRTNLDTTKKSFTSSSSSTLVSSSSSTVSTSWLGEQEVMVQISIAQNDNKSNVVPHRTFPVSEVLLHLKETGLVLVNSSSFESCRGRIFYNLHLQVEGTHQGVLVGLDREALSEKLLNLYEQAMARSS